MPHSPTTHVTLLVRLRNAQDKEAWAQFVDIYAPLLYRFARRQRLQDADAADLTQDVLMSVAGAIERFEYDRRVGTFRGWLFTVARNKIKNFVARSRRGPRATGQSDVQEMLANQPAADEDQASWDKEYESRLFDWAAERVRGLFAENTWRAFWMTAVEGKNPKDVARTVGVSVGAVYIAKSRVLAELKRQIQEIGE